MRVKKVRGTSPLTSLLSHGGERKIKVHGLYRGMEGGFEPEALRGKRSGMLCENRPGKRKHNVSG
jgi:hypothetical protein